jgi:hypothetical protein
MNQLMIFLLVLGVGLSAYAKARQAGVWSWWLFARTMLGMSALVALSAGCVVWLGSVLGPEHAWLVVLVDLVVVATGVTALALWLRPKPSRGPRSGKARACRAGGLWPAG